jgi:hypothetical protein
MQLVTLLWYLLLSLAMSTTTDIDMHDMHLIFLVCFQNLCLMLGILQLNRVCQMFYMDELELGPPQLASLTTKTCPCKLIYCYYWSWLFLLFTCLWFSYITIYDTNCTWPRIIIWTTYGLPPIPSFKFMIRLQINLLLFLLVVGIRILNHSMIV